MDAPCLNIDGIARKQFLRMAEVIYWKAMLEKHGGKIAPAMEEAKTNRSDGYKRLRRLGLLGYGRSENHSSLASEVDTAFSRFLGNAVESGRGVGA